MAWFTPATKPNRWVLPSNPITPSASHNALIGCDKSRGALRTWTLFWQWLPQTRFDPTLWLSACRWESSSGGTYSILLLHGLRFPGIFVDSCLHTWQNCESLSWVMCVYSPQALEVTPSRHWQAGMLQFACGDFQSGRSWREAMLPVLPFSSLALPWVAWGVGRTLPCFQKHSFLAARVNIMQKKGLVFNESQQCLSESSWKSKKRNLTELAQTCQNCIPTFEMFLPFLTSDAVLTELIIKYS